MAVSHDSFLDYSYAGGGSDTRNGPTPAGTPKGVLIFIFAIGVTEAPTSGITYGGVAMTRLTGAPWIDDGGEQGYCDVWFLGSGVASGQQSVAISGTGGFTKYVNVILIAASGDTQIVDSEGGSGDDTNPKVTLSSGGDTAIRYFGVMSGHDDPSSLTAVADTTELKAWDPGAQVMLVQRQTTPGSGDFEIGYTASSEDRAFAGVAIKEITLTTTTQTQTATARIMRQREQAQTATARIKQTRDQTQTATAKILNGTQTLRQQTATARLRVSRTKTQTATAKISVQSRTTRPQTATARIVSLVPENTWVNRGEPTSIVRYGSLQGFRENQGWNKLVWSAALKELVFMDVYYETAGTGDPTAFPNSNIYGNAIWSYNTLLERLTLVKRNNWIRSGGQTIPIAPPTVPNNTADPTPFSRHTYQCWAYSRARDCIYVWGGANAGVQGGDMAGNLWEFSFATGLWTQKSAGSPYNTYEQTMEWDEVGDRAIMHGARIEFTQRSRDTFQFNPATELMARIVDGSTTLVPTAEKWGATMCYDPVRRVMWFYGGGPWPNGSDQMWKLNLATDAWSLLPVAPPWPPGNRRWANLSYDSKRDRILFFGGVQDGGGNFTDTWMFNPNTEQWTQLSPAGTPPPSGSGVMAYDELNDVHVMMSARNFYIFRLGSGTMVKTQTATARIGMQATHQQTATAKILSEPLDQITVNEALPSGVSGLTRSQAPVSVGFPLKQSEAVTTVNALGLSGATAGQFRELSRWPNGALKWVLADFQVDVNAGASSTAVTLTRGSGAFGGSNLASDLGGGVVTVDTGPASFILRASPFRGFDQVTVNGVALLSTPGEGIEAVVGGVRYSSRNDLQSSSYSIEENGPVRCCIKASGALRNGFTRLCDFTVRLHFYKGKSYVRAFLTIRNANPSFASTFAFDSIEFNMQLSNTASLTFTTKSVQGGTPATHSAALAGGETVYAYQAYSDRWAWGQNDYADAPMDTGAQQGVEVRKVGGTIYRALNSSVSDYMQGWMALEDGSGRGCTFGIRHMGTLWPASVEASGDGTISIQPFSKRNSTTGILFAWGKHETREIFLDFHSSAPANRDTAFYDMEYPVEGRAPLSRYNATEAIFGETQLVTEAQQSAYFTAYGGSSPSLANITPQLYRDYQWPQGSGGNQMDFMLCSLIDWIRTGRGGFFLQGIRNSLFKADTATLHSDGFDYYTNQIMYQGSGSDAGTPGSGLNAGTFNGRTFDFAHPHWISMVLAYYLTGNEQLKEAVQEYGEWKYAYADGSAPNYISAFLSFAVWDQYLDARVWSRYLRDFALLYEFTGDARYLSAISTMVNNLLASADSPGVTPPMGKNRDRGYVWLSHGNAFTLPRTISDFMHTQIHFEACWEVYRQLEVTADTRLEAWEAYMQGLVDFWYNEGYLTKNAGTAPGDFGYTYSYKLDAYNPPESTPVDPFLRPIAGGRMWWFGYRMTGDAKYLTRGARLLLGDIGYVTARTPSDVPQQALMHEDLNRPTVGWRTVSPLQVIYLGGGTYRLRWVQPTGATAFRVRVSDPDEVMTDWLSFNQQTRVYALPPASYTPWFAATVKTAPAIGAPGQQIQVDVTGMNPAAIFDFMVKYSVEALPASTLQQQLATARIRRTRDQQQTATARILTSGQTTQVQTATARIRRTTDRQQTATARIATQTTQVQTATARIRRTLGLGREKSKPPKPRREAYRSR